MRRVRPEQSDVADHPAGWRDRDCAQVLSGLKFVSKDMNGRGNDLGYRNLNLLEVSCGELR